MHVHLAINADMVARRTKLGEGPNFERVEIIDNVIYFPVWRIKNEIK